MATGKVKKMALGGMGGISKVSNAKPGLTPAAQKAQFQRAGTTFGKPGGSQTAKTGLGQAMNKPTMGLGAAKKLAGVGALAGRALGVGKKKGGAVKKATKK